MSTVEEVRAADPRHRRTATKVYELLVALPLIAWIIFAYARNPLQFGTPLLLVWIAAIALVDLMPVPTSVELNFSLSFPLQLAVALIYPPPVAAAIAALTDEGALLVHVDSKPAGVITRQDLLGYLARVLAAVALLFLALVLAPPPCPFAERIRP